MKVDTLPNVQVTVDVDGDSLQEHEDDELEYSPKQVVRYIEAKSDQEFEIVMFVERPTKFKGSALAFYITVDGKFVDHPLIVSTSINQRGGCLRVSAGVKLPNNTMRRYRFANMERDASLNATKADEAKFKSLGTIRVDISHVNRNGYAQLGDLAAATAAMGAVSEKVGQGQAVSHNVAFSEAENAEASDTWKLQYIDPEKKPAASYIFKYRSLEALQSLMILPREPTPAEVPLEQRDRSTLTREELLELLSRSKQSENEREEKIKIKREDGEGGPRRRKAPRPSGGVTTIELDDNGNMVRETTVPRKQRSEGPCVDLDD